MTLANDVVKELVAIENESVAAKRAQAATMIRFGGGLHLVKRHIVVEAWFPHRDSAVWLCDVIKSVYNDDANLLSDKGNLLNGAKVERYGVSVLRQGGALALQTGLIDRNKRPVRGLPDEIVDTDDDAVALAAWRGAFLAQGILSDPASSSVLEVVCQSAGPAVALAGLAHRFQIVPEVRTLRSSVRVTLHDPEEIERLLVLMGAVSSGHAWSESRLQGAARGIANRQANFKTANQQRSESAAREAVTKVQRAFDILGDLVPPKLKEAGELRLQNPNASLHELGMLTHPTVTKDTIAGRIRRLYQLADRVRRERAAEASAKKVDSDQ